MYVIPLSYYGQICCPEKKIFCKSFKEIKLDLLNSKLYKFKREMNLFAIWEAVLLEKYLRHDIYHIKIIWDIFTVMTVHLQ